MYELFRSIKNWLLQYPVIYDNLKYAGVLLLAYVSYFVTRKIFFRIIRHLTRKTQTILDDVIFNEKMMRYLSLLVPLFIIHKFSYIADTLSSLIELTVNALIILYILLSIGNFINSITEYYSKTEKFARQPIKGYAQVVKMILYIFGALFIIGIFTGQNPWVILTGLGALSAVLLLVFKDTILGFVASIQIASNELFKIGDWIEMPVFGADGEVVDITLHTIKIQNWDKTFTLIPTYKLVENSFKNWQGMEQSGSRRIKRHVSIDIHTIKFIDDDKKKLILSSPFIDDVTKAKIKETDNFGLQSTTNLGLFIDYLSVYIAGRKDIRADLTSMVRALQPTTEGVPVEIYAFCSNTKLLDFETTQKEIFEHVIAIVYLFELSVFQQMSGPDLLDMVSNVKK